MVDGLMRGSIIAGLLILTAVGAEAAPKQAPDSTLNTEAFLAACVADPVVTDEPGLQSGSKVTAQMYCECIVGKYHGKKLSQADVDMMTKMHKDEITDEDATSYPTLEGLMEKNEGFEDECKKSLGMPANNDDNEEGAPVNEEDIPQDE
jgi:transcriptional regulator of met regulon